MAAGRGMQETLGMGLTCLSTASWGGRLLSRKGLGWLYRGESERLGGVCQTQGWPGNSEPGRSNGRCRGWEEGTSVDCSVAGAQGLVEGRREAGGQTVSRQGGYISQAAQERELGPRSQGEKALVAQRTLGPQEAASRSSHQQISLGKTHRGTKPPPPPPATPPCF